jgi:hypothetical protein
LVVNLNLTTHQNPPRSLEHIARCEQIVSKGTPPAAYENPMRIRKTMKLDLTNRAKPIMILGAASVDALARTLGLFG